MTEPVPAFVALRLSGWPHLRLPGGERVGLERHDAALLALLAIEGPTPRPRAATLLWPSAPLGVAQASLRQRLLRLKKRARHELFTDGPTLALDPGVGHDLAEASLDGDLDEPLLGGLDYGDTGELGDWVAAARERHRLRRLDALAARAEAHEAARHWSSALSCAERLVTAVPTSEHAHRRVMRLHYLNDDPAAATTAYARCRETLAAQLGVGPGKATRELAELVAQGAPLPGSTAAPASPSAAGRVALLRPPRLVGREGEWQRLEQARHDGATALLIGEPGIGKSRLAADFARAHPVAIQVAAAAGDRLVPYAALSRLLRAVVAATGAPLADAARGEVARLLPELGPPAPGQLEPIRLRHALGHAVGQAASAGAAATLVVDDLHHADDASLDMLLGWLGEPAALQVVLTVRAAEVPPALARWIADAPPAQLVVARLAPLDEPGTLALLESLAAPGAADAAPADEASRRQQARALVRRTGGNPLFLLETLRGRCDGAAPDALPPRLEALLDRDIAALPEAARRLARIAALAGADDFSVELAARVLEVGAADLAEAWGQLEEAHVFAHGAFRHDLIAEAALRAVPAALEAALHGRIAAAQHALGHAPARIAPHWRAAGQTAQAAALFEHAAAAAALAARPVEALRFWDDAVASHRQAGADDAAFRAAVQAAHAAVVVASEEEVAPRVAALVAQATNDDQALDALLLEAHHLGTNSRFREAEPVARRALALAEQRGDLPRIVRAALLHGAALAISGQASQAIALFEAKSPLLADLRDDVLDSEFSGAYCQALHAAGRIGDGVAWAERACLRSAHAGTRSDHAIALGNFAALLGRAGQHGRALQLAEQADALQRELGEPGGTPYVVSQLNLGGFRSLAGQLGEAEAAFRRGLDACTEPTARISQVVRHHLATLYLRLGQPARAQQTLVPLGDAAEPATRLRRAIVVHRIAAFSRPGDGAVLIDALARLGDASTLLDRIGARLAIGAALPPEDAVAWLERVHADAVAGQQATAALTARVLLADVLRRAGRAADAGYAATLAVEEAARIAWHDLETPLFWWLAHQALTEAGLPGAADAARAGVAWIEAALPHVPEAYRHGFLNRARGVPELMAAARRL